MSRDKITVRQHRILEALAACGDEMYGIDLVKTKVVSTWSLYVDLYRLEHRGWIESRWDDQPLEATRLRRRLYRITPAGGARLLPPAKVIE